MKPHKWAKEIKAWADGAEIEFLSTFTGNFELATTPDWNEDTQYRIKQQPKEPQYLYVYHTTKGIELGYAPHNGINMYNTKIVGKIKLENEDES